MLQRPDGRYDRLKYATQSCLDLRAVTFNDVFEDGCCEHKEGNREDDAAIHLSKVPVLRIRVEPPHEEDGGINLHIVFDGGKIRRLSFHETNKDNRVGHVDKEDGPQVGRRVQMP